MKFAHIADTHIRNLKYHYEYREVFKNLYDLLRKEKPDYIVHCGDIAHTKTQLSPEFIDVCSEFLGELAGIAPTYVILGNHDGNLKNSNRLDAITPIAEALAHPNLFILKNSGETHLDKDFCFNVLSVFDRDNWSNPTEPDKINIALHHGSISNCQTDLGWVMEHGENDLSIFNNFDFGFLGDIHKTNQILDKKGRIRYPGSTVQQNHGETNDKGFLIWDIKNKDSFTCKHFVLENPKPFVTVELTPKGRIPKVVTAPAGARLRLVAHNNLPLDIIRKAIDIAKNRFNPEVITFLNRAAGERGDVEDIARGLIDEDLRDQAVQEELIEEYLRDYCAEEQTIERVFHLNESYNRVVEDEEEVRRNINWKLKSLKWDNLFNYGEGNSINFENLNGIIGVFGKNFSGKSSIIDSLLYTVYNSTSKNSRKNLNIVNQNKDSGSGEVEIDIGHNTYVISRETEKYEKKLKGNLTTEAKTDVSFKKVNNALQTEESLNGITRNETDKNIRKVFGTMEDFLFTSMASQLGSLSFISEGSKRRKEILAKFLDLEIFEKKFRKANEDASDVKGALKLLQGRDFDQEAKELREELAKSEFTTDRKQSECAELSTDIDTLAVRVTDLDKTISSIPAEIIDIDDITEKLKNRYKRTETVTGENDAALEQIRASRKLVDKISGFLASLSIENLEESQRNITTYTDLIVEKAAEIDAAEAELKRHKRKTKLLDEVPCGEEFSHCKFIKDAYKAKSNLDSVVELLDSLKKMKGEQEGILTELEPKKIADHLSKAEQVRDKLLQTEREISQYELQFEKNKTLLLKLKQDIERYEEAKREYEDNKEVIENLEGLLSCKQETEKSVTDFKRRYEKCNSEALSLFKVNGSLEEKIKQIESERETFHDLEDKYAAYDLFMRCMHSNGISYDIIKRKLPLINAEVSKVLTNIVDFEIFFEDDGKKLDILIKHAKFEPRPIELGSGAEKTIAAMAIRLALLNVSNLPKGDIFILDEPGTALDEENMEGFTRILDLIKANFKTVLLISHLDGLKDIVDTQIIIEKEGGLAYVNQ
jgi:DNA repair exonuclease SbcCD ATPase subunit/DNA repair exonuclease SbcCD nuclease subunit